MYGFQFIARKHARSLAQRQGSRVRAQRQTHKQRLSVVLICAIISLMMCKRRNWINCAVLELMLFYSVCSFVIRRPVVRPIAIRRRACAYFWLDACHYCCVTKNIRTEWDACVDVFVGWVVSSSLYRYNRLELYEEVTYIIPVYTLWTHTPYKYQYITNKLV